MKYQLMTISALIVTLTILVAINPFGENVVDRQTTGAIQLR